MSPEPVNLAAARSVRGPGFATTGFWLGPPDRPLAGWWTAPEVPSRSGVVIAQPLGYEYWSCHRSLRTLAESLARAGWNALRFDWDGTGDSGGAADDPGRLAAWRASLAQAVATLREAGIERIALLGVRLGATLALLDAARLNVEQVVACAPVVSGKRLTRTLRMLGIADPGPSGSLMYAGWVIAPDTAADLAGIDLIMAAPPPVSRTLLLTRAESTDDELLESLRAAGHALDVHACEGMRSMLDMPSEDATLPPDFVPPVLAWLGAAPVAGAIEPTLRGEAEMAWQGGNLREQFTQADGLTAVRSLPAHDNPGTVVVFLNSGSEPHVGPGRAWVDYARALAVRGYACLRTDFRGWGESRDEGYGRGRPYDAHCVADTLRIVAALRPLYGRVVLAGLCAGAWVALKAAQLGCVAGVFALNPQLYWRPGDPVEALISDTHRRRTRARIREALGARWGLWSLLDLAAIRPMAARWLLALRRRRIPVMLSFAEGDDGLTFLRDRCGRRLARELQSGYLRVEEIACVDHQMYRLWRRPAVVAQLLRFLEALPPAASLNTDDATRENT